MNKKIEVIKTTYVDGRVLCVKYAIEYNNKSLDVTSRDYYGDEAEVMAEQVGLTFMDDRTKKIIEKITYSSVEEYDKAGWFFVNDSKKVYDMVVYGGEWIIYELSDEEE